MSTAPPPVATAWQEAFADRLTSVSDDPAAPLTVQGRGDVTPTGLLPITVTLDTHDIPADGDGLHLEGTEQFQLYIRPDAGRPPAVTVEHDRFLGFPHVLHGHELCIYLDPAREWNPADSATGFLNRLWAWLTDAATARFSASDALYHAIGGVPIGTNADEVLVVRNDVPTTPTRLWATRRTDWRLDVTAQPANDLLAVAFWPCAAPLPVGIGHTVGHLLDALTRGGIYRSTTILNALRTRSRRNGSQQNRLYFLLSVPHPTGGPPQLIGGRLDPPAVADLRAHASTFRQHPVRWCRISDERAAVTTRRDSASAASGFLDARVYLIGCGAIGSWLAEFITRAGAATILLADEAPILGGLLVRQNYIERDVGVAKSTALAARLRQVSDRTLVQDALEVTGEIHLAAIAEADFVIDATANVAAAHHVQRFLDHIDGHRGVVAQVATDPSTGTRGLALIAGTNETRPIAEIDERTERLVRGRAELEDFRPFWSRRPPGGQLVPTRGCSVPTFHRSAADVAAIAGVLTSVLGRHRDSPASGAYLFRLPGTARSPDVWLPAPSS